MFRFPLLVLLMLSAPTAPATWTEQSSRELLEKTLTVRLEPDLSAPLHARRYGRPPAALELLEARPDGLHIHCAKYHDVVGRLLREVLALQKAGDKPASDRFIEKYTRWDEPLHGEISKKMKAQLKYRYTLVRYAALGE